MKALFLVFHGFQEYNGISKKIRYQTSALAACGMDVRICHYEVTADGQRQWMADDTVLQSLGRGIIAKLRKRLSFRPILRYVREEGIPFVYIRSFHNANPFTIRLVRSLKRQGVRIFLEIPTYPYDREYHTLREKAVLGTDRLFRRAFCRYIEAIVTFSDDTEIFGRRTIRISNGIDFASIPLRRSMRSPKDELHLIAVAEIHFWHGFDRLIKGMKAYYDLHPAYKVYFHIVGNFFGERERQEIEPPIHTYGLESYVILHGAKHGEELDELFDRADFAIGSLGRHRSGISSIKTLKNREYAARGFGFIYSETDEDFDRMPYILKAPADETPIDIPGLIAFCNRQTMTPQEIRHSIRHLSWKEQMKKVCEDIQSHQE